MTVTRGRRAGLALPLALALVVGLAVTVAGLAWGTRVRASADRAARRADGTFAWAESVLVAASCGDASPGEVRVLQVDGPHGRLSMRHVAGEGSCWIMASVDGLPLLGLVKHVTGAPVTPPAPTGGVGLTPSGARDELPPSPVRTPGPLPGVPIGPSWVDLR